MALAAVLLLVPSPAGAGSTTVLEDPGKTVRLEAPGRWRTVESDEDLAATGFLGIKRAEIFLKIHADTEEPTVALRRWKDVRIRDGVTFAEPGGRPSCLVVHDTGASNVTYARGFSGRGKSAVVWLQAGGEPGPLDEEAFALLDLAGFPEPQAPGFGAEAGNPDGKPEEVAEEVSFQDADLRVELRLPNGWKARRDVKPDARRVISVEGRVGTDAEAMLDVYSFPQFDRVDALGSWWVDAEHRGWPVDVVIRGSPPSFAVLVEDEFWTRHVRLLDTTAGMYALKLDVDSQAEQASAAFLDLLVAGAFSVKLPRPEVPTPPPGFLALQDAPYHVLYECPKDRAESVVKTCVSVDTMVQERLGIEARGGRKGTVYLFTDQKALDTALRPFGVPEGTPAAWIPSRRGVFTHPGVVSVDARRSVFMSELAREAMQRRFGFPAPYWLESGMADLIGAGPLNGGRMDLAHPDLTVAARGAAAGSVDFERVRFWTHEESRDNVERRAIAWAIVYYVLEAGGADGKRFEATLKRYVTMLAETGSTRSANSAFDLAKDVEFVRQWGSFTRRL